MYIAQVMAGSALCVIVLHSFCTETLRQLNNESGKLFSNYNKSTF